MQILGGAALTRAYVENDLAEVPYATEPGNPSNPANSVALASWLRNPPANKPMAADPSQNPYANPGGVGTRGRGMPNLNLSEEQIDQLVAYLGHDDLWLPTHLAWLMEAVDETGALLAHTLTDRKSVV